jgi:hypothetical protein
MKRRIVLVVTALTLVALLVGASVVMAAKPQNSGSGKDVIALSNGFPSGQHFNLNIHGKDPETFVCDATPGGKSVFVAEYGASTIQYVSNKKASMYDLTVLDPCAMPDPYGDGVAKVQLPYKVLVDDTPTPAGGYYVFARILAKPNNGKLEPSSNIILYPNTVVEACNDTDPANPEFPNYTECPEEPELMLGLIVGNNLYVPDPGEQVLRRFEDPIPTRGRGKSKAVDITRLFTYTGWVVDARLDFGNSTNGCSGNMTHPEPDGQINECDLPADAWDIIADAGVDPNLYDDHPLFGNDSDSIDTIEEWLAYNADLDPPMAWYFANHWIFDIADLVITEQGLMNDGTKLVQLRFYPVVTTTFGSHIVVEKDAPADGLTAFGFDPSYGNAFSLRDGETKDSGALKAGTYTVTEILPLSGDWTLDEIEIIDLDPSTTNTIVDETAEISLAPGETVRVIFHNVPTP